MNDKPAIYYPPKTAPYFPSTPPITLGDSQPREVAIQVQEQLQSQGDDLEASGGFFMPVVAFVAVVVIVALSIPRRR